MSAQGELKRHQQWSRAKQANPNGDLRILAGDRDASFIPKARLEGLFEIGATQRLGPDWTRMHKILFWFLERRLPLVGGRLAEIILYSKLEYLRRFKNKTSLTDEEVGKLVSDYIESIIKTINQEIKGGRISHFLRAVLGNQYKDLLAFIFGLYDTAMSGLIEGEGKRLSRRLLRERSSEIERNLKNRGDSVDTLIGSLDEITTGHAMDNNTKDELTSLYLLAIMVIHNPKLIPVLDALVNTEMPADKLDDPATGGIRTSRKKASIDLNVTDDPSFQEMKRLFGPANMDWRLLYILYCNTQLRSLPQLEANLLEELKRPISIAASNVNNPLFDYTLWAFWENLKISGAEEWQSWMSNVLKERINYMLRCVPQKGKDDEIKPNLVWAMFNNCRVGFNLLTDKGRIANKTSGAAANISTLAEVAKKLLNIEHFQLSTELFSKNVSEIVESIDTFFNTRKVYDNATHLPKPVEKFLVSAAARSPEVCMLLIKLCANTILEIIQKPSNYTQSTSADIDSLRQKELAQFQEFMRAIRSFITTENKSKYGQIVQIIEQTYKLLLKEIEDTIPKSQETLLQQRFTKPSGVKGMKSLAQTARNQYLSAFSQTTNSNQIVQSAYNPIKDLCTKLQTLVSNLQ